MDWFVLFLVAAAAIAVARIVYQVRRTATRREDDWDAKLIERLRRSGMDPFKSWEIDFFLAMPTFESAQQLARMLEREGYAVDVREVTDGGEHPISVHALKAMQLNVPAVQSCSHRLRELAAAGGGRYDGWAPGKSS